MNEVNPKAVVKIGDTRINLNHITCINTRVSKDLQRTKFGITENNYAKDEDRFPGKVVTIYFIGDSDQYGEKFYAEEAEEFLKLYDLYFGIPE